MKLGQRSLMLIVILVAALRGQGQHGTIVTSGTGTAGVQIESDSAYPDVVIKTGNSSTSGFRIFNSGDATLLNVTASGDVAIGTSVTPPERLYVYENVDANSLIMVENPNIGAATIAGLRAQSDVATVSFQAHSSARTLSRFGVVLGGWAEFFSYRGNGLAMGTLHAAPLVFGTNNLSRLKIASDGMIAVGLSPPVPLPLSAFGVAQTTGDSREVLGVYDSAPFGENVGGGIALGGNFRTTGITVTQEFGSIEGVKENPIEGDYAGALTFNTRVNGGQPSERVRITSAGNVAIGTTGPVTARLHVQGDVFVSGNIAAKYQDVAEWVPSRDDLAPGTVVVLDRAVGNGVLASTTAYDTTVAGVVSAQPGIILGEASQSKEQVATSGRVRVKVDASHGAIAVGDLLVTSDKPGFAMRSDAIEIQGRKFHQPGTIIGKALEALATGEGEILVLLSLQ
ncbi:MAG: hypothetical protein ABI779_26945 [Acidobacteriota bacterium]